jgi:hypothetical protein
VPTLALIVIAVVAVLLSAMLLAGGRRAARPHTRHAPSPFDDDAIPYRSHAEASRHSGES